jgi:hypothetical protein
MMDQQLHLAARSYIQKVKANSNSITHAAEQSKTIDSRSHCEKVPSNKRVHEGRKRTGEARKCAPTVYHPITC